MVLLQRKNQYTEWPKKMYTLFIHQYKGAVCIHFLGHSVLTYIIAIHNGVAPIKILDEAETCLLKPNSWRIMMMMLEIKLSFFFTLCRFKNFIYLFSYIPSITFL
jgi:hypothetical protein